MPDFNKLPLLASLAGGLRKLRNHVNEDCLKKVANSIYTSKIRYGLQVYAKMKWMEADTKIGVMKELQKTQNKLLRFLNKTRIKDKIKMLIVKFLSDFESDKFKSKTQPWWLGCRGVD